MSTTVSRRVVFIKTKNKRVPPKPKTPSRDDDQVVGEAARPSAPLRVMPPMQPAPFRPNWMLIGASLGGLVMVCGIIAAAISYFAGLPGGSTEPRTAAAPPSSAGSPAYGGSRSHGGYPGASGGAGATNGQISMEQAFLNAPFRKRKPARGGCSVQAEYSKENLVDLQKCLEQGN